ncbi:MAG TPA: hypothetical protein VGP73_09395 [Thermoanaerobaculia bacterium]
MCRKPVIILGAGATKACGGPLTDEILPAALNGNVSFSGRAAPVMDRESLLSLMRDFLTDCFNVPRWSPIEKTDCPSLPMLLSMLRRSQELDEPLGNWSGERLVDARRAIEYAVFAVIEAALGKIPSDRQFHLQLLAPFYRAGVEPVVVSLNYDVIVDNAMFSLGERFQGLRAPDYCVEISTDTYNRFRGNGSFGRLLKIHGSLNWLYCERCRRLDLFVTEGMRGLRTAKALDALYHSVPFDDAYSCRGTPCRNRPQCDGFVSPILITPTYVKDYENPRVQKVWRAAEATMKQADRAIIIGYSLPTDDVEVAMLLKRGLDHLPRQSITVVEYVDGDAARPQGQRTPLEQHPTGQRFRTLFGSGLDWHTTGFEGWLREQSPWQAEQ